MIYNAILRQFPETMFEAFGDNHFATSIHVLQSAVSKLARNTKIPTGLRLFRGLSMSFPTSFYESDTHGCRGFAEWGFMSTTANRDIAIQYSGVKDAKKEATVLEIHTSSVDRGACIQDYSQYQDEKEYLWVPLSFLESTRIIRKEATELGMITVIDLRVSANLKASTCEEIFKQKKTLHLTTFRARIDEISRNLHDIAAGEGAQSRLAETKKYKVDRAFNMKHLVDTILNKAKDVLTKHETTLADKYNEDGVFKMLVQEMMDVSTHATSLLHLFIEDKTKFIKTMLNLTLSEGHRSLITLRSEALKKQAFTSNHEQKEEAEQLCVLRGLVTGPGRANEVDHNGADALCRFLVDGVGTYEGVRMLFTAGAGSGGTALLLSAKHGRFEAVTALLDHRVPVDWHNQVKLTPDYGHSDTSAPFWEDLLPPHHRCLTCVLLMEQEGTTGLMTAAKSGHLYVVQLLVQRGAQVNSQTKNGVSNHWNFALFL